MASAFDRNGFAVFALCLGVLAGCGQDKIDQIKSGGGCETESGAGLVGRCPNDVLACQAGFANLDGTSNNGCEAALPVSGDTLMFKVADGGVAEFVINEFPLDTDIIDGWVAIKGAACTADMTSPCSYELKALQLQVSDFVFDGLSFSQGFFALPKPMAVTDNGEGLVVPADAGIIASFLVDGHKRVVSLGSIEGGLAVQMMADRKTVTINGSELHVSFGGCTMDTGVAASGLIGAENAVGD